MAYEAGRVADLAVLTSDNPRTEDPLAIIADAEEGFRDLDLKRIPSLEAFDKKISERGSDQDKPPGGYLIEPDRALAIKAACRLMEKGDIVLIAGKGHEDYQIVGQTKRHFLDREEALIALKELGKN
jgi:UDP-N-acetylmuramoyl-L-alanyl-D-glutamate--2,6-diaminopimelate ligase